VITTDLNEADGELFRVSSDFCAMQDSGFSTDTYEHPIREIIGDIKIKSASFSELIGAFLLSKEGSFSRISFLLRSEGRKWHCELGIDDFFLADKKASEYISAMLMDSYKDLLSRDKLHENPHHR